MISARVGEDNGMKLVCQCLIYVEMLEEMCLDGQMIGVEVQKIKQEQSEQYRVLVG